MQSSTTISIYLVECLTDNSKTIEWTLAFARSSAHPLVCPSVLPYTFSLCLSIQHINDPRALQKLCAHLCCSWRHSRFTFQFYAVPFFFVNNLFIAFDCSSNADVNAVCAAIIAMILSTVTTHIVFVAWHILFLFLIRSISYQHNKIPVCISFA